MTYIPYPQPHSKHKDFTCIYDAVCYLSGTMNRQLVELSSDSAVLGEYERLDVASVAARQLVKSTGTPITVRVYDVTDTSKALTRKFRMLRSFDGIVVTRA